MPNIFDSAGSRSIHDYWPMPQYTPRVSQSHVLEWIEKLPSHIKYILAEIPVGGGKSPIAINLSGFISKGHGDAYVITPQKILQKQYEDSFDPKLIHSIYGKSNYRCDSKNTDCETGSDIRPKCANCPYKNALHRCKTSPNVVMNYAMAINLFAYQQDADFVRKRKLMVMDEAHMMESVLTEHMSMVFSEHRCKQINIPYLHPTDMHNAIRWVRDKYVVALREKVKKLDSYVADLLDQIEFGNHVPNKTDLEQFKLLKELSRHLDAIQENVMNCDNAELNERYVMVTENRSSFKFKLLYGAEVFKSVMEPMAERFLFMSSTILNKEAFCADLGIDPSQAAFISLESEFELDNRPIFFMPTASMAYGWDSDERKSDRDYMVKKIVDLCNQIHPDENGVIHTGSFQVAKWLVDELRGKVKHKIFHHNPEPGKKVSRDSVIEAFQSDAATAKILISPSVTEGLDLKGDKGRFAIFAKVPFPYLGDAWVKRRMTISGEWYTRQALIQMIQGGGRVVRSHDDWGHVYILDSSFQKLYNMSKRFIPKWWDESIQRT